LVLPEPGDILLGDFPTKSDQVHIVQGPCMGVSRGVSRLLMTFA
jgi:hypothetical protein